MNAPAIRASQRQHGVTLVIGLIMLVVMTLMLTSTFRLRMYNAQAVGNLQFRDEAIASANWAIEQKLGSLCTGACTTLPSADPAIDVDVDQNNAADYTVAIAQPVCIQVAPAGAAALSSLSLPAMSGAQMFNTVWDIPATVDDPDTGARIRVNVGVRLLLTTAQRDAICP